jgi:tetratricopeptide (TPR) repeat protein
MHPAYAEKGLTILAVNVDKQQLAAEDLDKIRAVVAEKKPPFPVVIDEGLKVYNEYGVMVTPTTALVDNAGVMAWEVSGYSSAGTGELEAAIRKALGVASAEETALPRRKGYEPHPEAMRMFGMGKRMVDKTLTDKAIPDLAKAAEADSNYASPGLYLGYAYLRTKREGGEAFIKRAAELDPAAPEPPLLLAYLAAEAGDPSAAIAILDAALEAQKKSSADAVAGGFREEPVPFSDLDLSGPRGMGAGEAKPALLSLLGERLAKAGLSMGTSGKKMSLADKMKARFDSQSGGAPAEGAEPAPEAPAP